MPPPLTTVRWVPAHSATAPGHRMFDGRLLQAGVDRCWFSNCISAPMSLGNDLNSDQQLVYSYPEKMQAFIRYIMKKSEFFLRKQEK
jgi:hypothetical protein